MTDVTFFHGIQIIHPNSGKVSRSIIERIVRQESHVYKQEVKEAASQLLKYGNTLILSDSHNQIKGALTLDPNI